MITATEPRRNVYKILDEVLDAGTPQEIVRNAPGTGRRGSTRLEPDAGPSDLIVLEELDMEPSTRARWVLLAVVGAGCVADGAFACSCGRRADPPLAFDEADAVFAGTVTAIDRRDDPRWLYELLAEVDHRLGTTLFPDAWDVAVDLSVDSAWKGVTSTRVRVQTGSGGGDCGVPFRAGDRYLIYATFWEDALFTSICTRTAPPARAIEDLAHLAGVPQLTLKAPSTSSRATILASLLAAVLVSLAALRLRSSERVRL